MCELKTDYYLRQLLTDGNKIPEFEVRLAIESFWHILHPGYEGVKPSDVGMDGRLWKPDKICVYRGNYNDILLTEFKGNPPNGNLDSALSQIVGYAKDLHFCYPDATLRLNIIGPWHSKDDFEPYSVEGYSVSVFSCFYLGQMLQVTAENLLRDSGNFLRLANVMRDVNNTPKDNVLINGMVTV